MVSDDERREVAERLRSVAREVDRGGFSETIKHVKLAVFEDLDRYRPNGTLDRLADLIEPEPERTCRKVPGRMKYGRRMPKCSECGQSLGDERWVYCPNCGAMVVEE